MSSGTMLKPYTFLMGYINLLTFEVLFSYLQFLSTLSFVAFAVLNAKCLKNYDLLAHNTFKITVSDVNVVL